MQVSKITGIGGRAEEYDVFRIQVLRQSNEHYSHRGGRICAGQALRRGGCRCTSANRVALDERLMHRLHVSEILLIACASRMGVR